MALHFDSVVLGPLENNVYFLWEDSPNSPCLLIDAACDAPAIEAAVKERGVDVVGVFTTHRHHDHVGALKEILETYKVPHYASAEEAELYPVAPTVPLKEGDRITLGAETLTTFIIHGHTEGGAVLSTVINGVPHLFVGDNLFPGGVGKTNSPAEFAQLYGDVVDKIFEKFPDETVILPGHGKATTLGAERPHLAEWKERGW
ncbi:MAG: MBL fold metallo-hydrolase [Corynebacterium sp.]|nr:MBL fold metallo-hydrolase [Corynebacterium sp.]